MECEACHLAVVYMILVVVLERTWCDIISETETTTPSLTETDDDQESVLSDLEALGDVEVEKNLFDVTITLPAECAGDVTQEELNVSAAENGYQATLNEDGSVTYVMTKKQHAKMLESTTEEINNALADMIGFEAYANFTDIKANDDFTSSTVTTTSTELGLMGTLSVMIFYTYGGMYNVFAGNHTDNSHVDFVNTDSGEIISSADSSDLGE